LSDSVIIETELDFSQLGVEKVLGVQQDGGAASKSVRRLRTFVASAEVPPGSVPLLGYSRAQPDPSLRALLTGNTQHRSSRVEWLDCPIALKLHSIEAPVIALNIHFQSGPTSNSSEMTSVLIVTRACLDHLIRLLETIDRRDSLPKLHMHRGRSRKIAACSWDDLVLDPAIMSLLKNDFEQFWNREPWFRERHLPFRRGYLLHGPPGNGKSTAIRAMMCSRSLGAFTIRLFDHETGDANLDQLFDDALRERPAMILFEDLDRAFPREGEPGSRVSLQHLLNCLDGVSSGDGIVVVATANDPATLDPAILRRPGRFDRVVHFPNPNSELRCRYLQSMSPELTLDTFQEAAEESKGFSFAQLREAVVLAAQYAFESEAELTEQYLLGGIRTLRHTMVQSSMYSNAAGFGYETNPACDRNAIDPMAAKR
jgi:hypothetical protein